MSKEDLEEVANILLRPHQKTENKKLAVWILGFTGTILTIGFVGGDWHFWRSSVQDWVIESKQEIKEHQSYIDMEQGASNKKKMDYINSIHTKK